MSGKGALKPPECASGTPARLEELQSSEFLPTLLRLCTSPINFLSMPSKEIPEVVESYLPLSLGPNTRLPGPLRESIETLIS